MKTTTKLLFGVILAAGIAGVSESRADTVIRPGETYFARYQERVSCRAGYGGGGGGGWDPRPQPPQPPHYGGRSFDMDCDSWDKQPNACAMGNVYVEHVELVQSRSSGSGACSSSNWRHDGRNIYVNGGCRGLFRVYYR